MHGGADSASVKLTGIVSACLETAQGFTLTASWHMRQLTPSLRLAAAIANRAGGQIATFL